MFYTVFVFSECCFSDGFVLFRRGFRLCGGEKHTLLCGIASHEPQYQSTNIAAGKGWKPSMDQAQWAQTEIALLPTEQIALRPSVQQKSLSHMPLETLAASMAREGLREPILVRAAAQGYMIVEGNRRLMACRMLGWREIPARVQPKDVSDMTSAGEIFAALRARPMGYLDRAEAANRLTADFGMPRAAIAQQTGDSAAHVLSLQRIATLDDRTRDILRQERLPGGGAAGAAAGARRGSADPRGGRGKPPADCAAHGKRAAGHSRSGAVCGSGESAAAGCEAFGQSRQCGTGCPSIPECAAGGCRTNERSWIACAVR